MNESRDITGVAALYRRLLRYTKPYWKGFAVSILAMIIYAGTDAGFAALMKPMLDGSFVDRDPDVIAMIPVLIIGLFLLRGVMGFISTYGMSWVGRNLIRDMRREMFQQMLRLPTRQYDQTSSGQLIAKLIFDVEQIAQAGTNAITILVRDTFTILALLAWLAYLNWQLTALFLLVGPPIAYAVGKVSKRFRTVSRKIQTSIGDVTHVAEEAVEGHRVIKTFGGQDYETAHFARANETNRHQNMKLVAVSNMSTHLIQLIAATALSGIIYFATRPEMLENITPGTFMSFITAMMMLLPPMKRLTSVNVQIQRGIAAANSIFGLLDSEAESDTGTGVLGRAAGAVEFRALTFAYDPSKGKVLSDINLNIKPGESVAIVGRSGSGKSTLVSLLPRFYDPTAGSILIDGHDIRELTLRSLRDQIAWVGQDVVLFNDSIARNIAYGALGDVQEEDIVRAATAAHAMEFIAKLPERLNTMVGENGVLLSGGQRQRLAIARALLKDAPILILDEATSALDTESERYIQAALTEVMRNRTTLVIAHRLSTIEHADRIVVMDSGRIVEQGGHAELLERGGHYASLHRLQFQRPDALEDTATVGVHVSSS